MTRQTKVFQNLTELCDIVQVVFAKRANICRGMDESSRLTLHMLILTSISSVLEIYQCLCSTYATAADHKNMTPESGSKEAHGDRYSWTPAHLSNILQLTTMEFHLRKIEKIFKDTDSKDLPEFAGSDLGVGRVQQQRKHIHQTIEALRH